MIISDINTAGASSEEWRCTDSEFQIVVGGTFNGGTVDVQQQITGTSTWVTIASITEDSKLTVEDSNYSDYRTNTTHGGSAPSLTAEVIGPGDSIEER